MRLYRIFGTNSRKHRDINWNSLSCETDLFSSPCAAVIHLPYSNWAINKYKTVSIIHCYCLSFYVSFNLVFSFQFFCNRKSVSSIHLLVAYAIIIYVIYFFNKNRSHTIQLMLVSLIRLFRLWIASFDNVASGLAKVRLIGHANE